MHVIYVADARFIYYFVIAIKYAYLRWLITVITFFFIIIFLFS